MQDKSHPLEEVILLMNKHIQDDMKALNEWVETHCARCLAMSSGRKWPRDKEVPIVKKDSACPVCNKVYCSTCYDITHSHGKCYICGAAGCYCHDIGKIVCYDCL